MSNEKDVINKVQKTQADTQNRVERMSKMIEINQMFRGLDFGYLSKDIQRASEICAKLNNPFFELQKSLNLIRNDKIFQSINNLQKSLQPITEQWNRQAELLKPIVNQWNNTMFQHKELFKSLNGLSISFLLQSQTITKETYNNQEDTTRTPIKQEQTISKASIKIESLSEVKNDIQELRQRMDLVESQKLIKSKEDVNQDCQKLIWLSLSNKGLIINDTLLYHTFKPNVTGNMSINERLIRHLINYPNEEFSREELVECNVLDEKDGGKYGKDFRVCLQDMKFENDFARLFFDASRDTIKLINPITPEVKKKRGISYIPMPKSSKDKKRKPKN